VTSYSFGYLKGRNRTIKVTAETDDIAKAAANLLMKAVQRKQEDREAVKDLTDAAIRSRKLAESYRWKGPDAEEIRKHYLAKAADYIKEAAQIIAEGER
jgi:hypothetical protein